MSAEHIAGKDAGRIMLYALSTCGWCAKTRQLLEELGVEYNYEYVDQLQGEARRESLKAMERWNPASTFPTLVIGDETCIIGFKADKIREALSL
jgi:glutaredoxin